MASEAVTWQTHWNEEGSLRRRNNAQGVPLVSPKQGNFDGQNTTLKEKSQAVFLF
jgi:hypothetical protein